MSDASLARLRAGLQANGLSTDGKVQVCLDPLLSAGTSGRGHGVHKRKKQSVVHVVEEALCDKIEARLARLSAATLVTVMQELHAASSGTSHPTPGAAVRNVVGKAVD